VSDGRGGSLLLAGMCLDDFNWGTAPGSLVVVWGCSGQPNQRWTVGGDGTIRSVFAPSLCIAAEGGGRGAGTRLVLLACDGGSSQVWTRT
jgi:alpha-galactosidase